MSNVLSAEKREQVVALGRLGWSLRRIEQTIGVRRETASASAGDGAWRWNPRQSGAGSSTTVLNWGSGCVVISNQPTGPTVSMRPTFVSMADGAAPVTVSLARHPHHDCAAHRTPDLFVCFRGRTTAPFAVSPSPSRRATPKTFARSIVPTLPLRELSRNKAVWTASE